MSSVDNKAPQHNTENNGNSSAKTAKIVSLVANILIYVFCALCVILLIFAIATKSNGEDTVKIFGREMRIVTSGSMEKNENTYNDIKKFKIKSIKTRSVIFIRTVPQDDEKADEWYSELQVGDVLTFKYVVANKQVIITHRIVDVERKATGGYVITLKGDNDNDLQTIDTSIEGNPNYVMGKVTGKNFLFGFFITALKTPLGMSLLVIVPCAIIIILQVINIVNAVNENKRKVAEEEVAQRQSDIDELKRKIAELESLKSNADNQDNQDNSNIKDNEHTSNKEENDV